MNHANTAVNIAVTSSDTDYWSFTANPGDRLTVASETAGSPVNSSLIYAILAPDGTQLTAFGRELEALKHQIGEAVRKYQHTDEAAADGVDCVGG